MLQRAAWSADKKILSGLSLPAIACMLRLIPWPATLATNFQVLSRLLTAFDVHDDPGHYFFLNCLRPLVFIVVKLLHHNDGRFHLVVGSNQGGSVSGDDFMLPRNQAIEMIERVRTAERIRFLVAPESVKVMVYTSQSERSEKGMSMRSAGMIFTVSRLSRSSPVLKKTDSTPLKNFTPFAFVEAVRVAADKGIAADKIALAVVERETVRGDFGHCRDLGVFAQGCENDVIAGGYVMVFRGQGFLAL